MTNQTLSLPDIQNLAQSALEGAGASKTAAASVARSTVRAERDGIRSHGLMYVPIYAEHVICGKVDGNATPTVTQNKPGSVIVDAASGFAHPAIDAGWEAFTNSARDTGVAALTIHNSYNCGVLGHHAERLAEEGLLGLCFTHAPASIAPVGGRTPVIGTNPFAVGVPDGNGGAAILIDQSASAIAKSEIMLRSRTGEAIEPHWAFDENGEPTTDASAALKGTMAPAGGYKGFGIGLLVEIMASALAGAQLSRDASPFSGTKGGPPGTGQCFLAFDTNAFSGAQFQDSISSLCQAIDGQEGARLPGARRLENRARIGAEGVVVPDELIEKIRGFAC